MIHRSAIALPVTRRRHSHATTRRDGGQALTEMALALPILLLVIFALFEAGAFAFAFMTVEHATQDGGRLAALPGTPDETTVKNHVIGRAAHAPVTLSPSNVAIIVSGCSSSPCTYSGRASGDRVRVVVTYAYRPLIAMVFGNSTTFSLTARTEYHVE